MQLWQNWFHNVKRVIAEDISGEPCVHLRHESKLWKNNVVHFIVNTNTLTVDYDRNQRNCGCFCCETFPTRCTRFHFSARRLCNGSVYLLLLCFSHSYLSRIAPKISVFLSPSLSLLYNCSTQTVQRF